MKLSDLKPCACCGGPLLRTPMIGIWYVLRVTKAMLSPRSANQVLGLTQFFQGNLALAEAFAPGANSAVLIMGDQDSQLMKELHICFDCVHNKLGKLGEILESRTAIEAIEETPL